MALLPGQTVVAFTDGLVETRSTIIDTGLDRLRRAALKHGGLRAQDLVKSIKEEMIPAGSEDDVAFLAIRFSPASIEDPQRDQQRKDASVLGV